MKLYKKYAKYYDYIYYEEGGKSYKKQVNFIISQIKKDKINGKRLLDVACGTGIHSKFFKQKGYDVVGTDLNKEMLQIAKKKVKGVRFIQQDMRKLKLNKKFDIITCLFGSIHYNNSIREFKKTLTNFYNHLDNRGILIFDTQFVKENLDCGHRWVDGFEKKDFCLTRCSRGYIKNNKVVLPMVYVIQMYGKNIIEEDTHKMTIYTINQIKKIMAQVGFKTKVVYERGTQGKIQSKVPYFVGIK